MNTSVSRFELSAFFTLGIIAIASVLAAFQTEQYYLVFLPFGLMIAYLAVINFRLLYFFLLFSIPPSIEYSFSGSLGTDLPDEPLMIGLMLVTTVYLLTNLKALPKGFFGNVLIVALVAHVFWIFVSSILSEDVGVSLKYFAAKLWYVFAFCLLTAIVVRKDRDYKWMFWSVFIPLTLLIIQVIVRHGMQGFSFDEINKPMMPFFRNHVNYAAIVSIFFPFLFWARSWYPKGSFRRRLLSLSMVLYVAAIYLSYTRTSYIAVALLLPAYFVIRYKLMKVVIAGAALGILITSVYLFSNNTYLDYAPNFRETIIHDEFGQHLSSTFEGKDISSMERVYRWVAAIHMFQDHPWFGFGPGNFYPYYKSYTVTSFETYVSDNPEHSTTHNYALMLLTEQGTIGLALFLILSMLIFIKGEKIYHSITNREDKMVAMIMLLVIVMVYVNLLLSDMMETDKVGPFFFIALAILVSLDIKQRSLKAQSE